LFTKESIKVVKNWNINYIELCPLDSDLIKHNSS
jgi:hypothetical protein